MFNLRPLKLTARAWNVTTILRHQASHPMSLATFIHVEYDWTFKLIRFENAQHFHFPLFKILAKLANAGRIINRGLNLRSSLEAVVGKISTTLFALFMRREEKKFLGLVLEKSFLFEVLCLPFLVWCSSYFIVVTT